MATTFRALILEAETVQELVSGLEDMIPAMMVANGLRVGGNVEFDLDAHYHGTAHALQAWTFTPT